MVFKARSLILSFLLLAGLAQFAQGSWIHIKAVVAQQLLSYAWERSLETGLQSKPWPWADTAPIARLQLPRLGVDTIVLNGDHGQALAFGPGQANAGSLPGDPGVTLISGHRDTHFRFMRDVEVGDRVTVIDSTGSKLVYQVTNTQIVNADHTEIESTETEQLLLATCWPFDSIVPGGPLRFVVFAEPVELFNSMRLEIT